MAIIRVHRTDDYTVMSNYHLRDTGLSWQAMGLLSFMMSCTENFKFSINGLKEMSASGDAATRTALNELKEKGYVVVTRQTDDKGRVTEWTYDIYETPQNTPQDVCASHVENQHVANQRNKKYINKEISNKELYINDDAQNFEKKEKPEKVKSDFENFWEIYDKKVGRKSAERMWGKLNKSQKVKIFEKLPAYIAATPDKQYRMNPSTFINPANERWEDELNPSQSHERYNAGNSQERKNNNEANGNNNHERRERDYSAFDFS
ncbi:MAG: hypothetical protein NC035_08980 [Bacteroides sp.]|nr:hypothetical protein [Bacteroides sp.]